MKATGELQEKLDCNGVTIKNGSRFFISQIYGACYATKLQLWIIVVLVKFINMLHVAVIPSNQSLVFLQTNQSLRRLETTSNFAVNHCKQDIWKQNVFGHSKLPNKTGVFTLVTISTHFSILCFCVRFPRSFQQVIQKCPTLFNM